MSSSHRRGDGVRRAEQYVRMLAENLAGEESPDCVHGPPDCIFLGAGLLALAREEARQLPPAQRAPAYGRQRRLARPPREQQGPEALTAWLRRLGEEVLFVRTQLALSSHVRRRCALLPAGRLRRPPPSHG